MRAALRSQRAEPQRHSAPGGCVAAHGHGRFAVELGRESPLVPAARSRGVLRRLVAVPAPPTDAGRSGFLVVGEQWSRGASLYGDLWVDRPPLLVALFALAGHLGGVTATQAGAVAPVLKLLGALASAAAVLLAGVLGSVTAPQAGWSRRAAVVLTVALLCSPLLGMPETDGEILAVPVVLLGLSCLAASLRRAWGWRSALFALVAGMAAVSAALIKQNVVDVVVFGIVLLYLVQGRVGGLGARAAVFASGSVTMLAAALAGAWWRGSSPIALWDAVVMFRLQASSVLDSHALSALPDRFSRLLLASWRAVPLSCWRPPQHPSSGVSGEAAGSRHNPRTARSWVPRWPWSVGSCSGSPWAADTGCTT